MGDDNTGILQGTLNMLILKAIAGEPMHGFGVARWIEGVTDGGLSIQEGALYPAMHRLEKRGLVEAEWRVTENSRRAKYYRITRAGRAELRSEIERWEGSWRAVQRVLRA